MNEMLESLEQWPGREPRWMAALEGRGQQECRFQCRHLLGRLQAHAGGAAVEAPRMVLRDPRRSSGSERCAQQSAAGLDLSMPEQRPKIHQ